MAKPQWSTAKIISQLDSGWHWSTGKLTYAFATNAYWFPGDEATGFSALNSKQQATATAAVKLWDDLIAPDFALSNNAGAHIKFSNTTTSIGYAHAYYPGNYTEAGSVWLNPSYSNNSGTNNLVAPAAGQWGFQAYVHELGHALGLDHPGEYNGGTPTYAKNAAYQQDSQQYSIMSYFLAAETGADWVASDGKMYFPQTPMLHDIAAIQAIYGAETTTRAGNTVYGYGSNAGDAVFDFAKNPHPIICIYDSGGIDTLSLSGSNYACTLDLTPGAFSNTDKMTSNISIAFDTWIENATGGKAADKIIGNKLANKLVGQAGNDKIYGENGNDTLCGGDGDDVLYGGAGNDALRGDKGNDKLYGEAGNDALYSGEGADYLYGGDGNDTLYGENGNDWLIGGAGKDKLFGGRGADVFQFANPKDSTCANFDAIGDFSAKEGDHIDLQSIDANTRVSGDQAFTFLKSGSFTGKAGQLYFKNEHLYGDVNGDKKADFDIHLVALKSLHVSDIWL